MKRNRNFQASKIAISIFFILVFPPHYLYAEERQDSTFFANYFERLGDKLYAYRDIDGNLDIAQISFQRAKKFTTRQVRINWKLARGFWIQGRQTPGAMGRLNLFEKAVNLSEQAIKINPESSLAHLWHAVAIGSTSQEKGILNSLYLKDDVRRELELALKLDRKNIKAYLGLATWYYVIPPLLGGGKDTAFGFVERAIALDQKNTESLLIKAKFLKQEDEYLRASQLLKKIIHLGSPSSRAKGVINKTKARLILKKIKLEKKL